MTATSLLFCDATAAATFAAAGLDTLAALCASDRGAVVTTAATRTCRRIELEGVVYFVKTQDLVRRRLPRRKLLSYWLRGSPLVRERRALARLAAIGVAVPPVVAAGCERHLGWPRRAALVTREVQDHVDLATWAGTPAAVDVAVADATFAAARRAIEHVHAAGFVLRGARFRNLLVPMAGCDDPARVVLLDQPDLCRSCSRRGRRRDLAAFDGDRARFGVGR